MSVENFLDTNVFVYLFDETDDFKRQKASVWSKKPWRKKPVASVIRLSKRPLTS